MFDLKECLEDVLEKSKSETTEGEIQLGDKTYKTIGDYKQLSLPLSSHGSNFRDKLKTVVEVGIILFVSSDKIDCKKPWHEFNGALYYFTKTKSEFYYDDGMKRRTAYALMSVDSKIYGKKPKGII